MARGRLDGEDAVPRGLAVAAAVLARIVVVLVSLELIGYALGKLLLVVLPVIVALLLATIMVPVAHRLRDRGVHERAAALLVVLATIALMALALVLIVPPFVSQLGEVGTSAEEGTRKVGELLAPLGVSETEVNAAIDKGVKDLKGSGGKLAGSAAKGATAALSLLGALLLTLVLAFFFVKDGRKIWDWLAGLFGPDRQQGVHELGERSWKVLTGYVHGVAIVAALDTLLIGIALVVAGVPLAMPLIVLTFLAGFFPVIGAVVAGAAAVLVALVAKGGLTAVIIAVVILVVQQLEGNVFQPMLVGRRLALHPVAVLLALTTGGVLAGIVGAFVAVPLAAVAASTLSYAREQHPQAQRGA